MSLLSEPPDVRNWFPSYEYESPVLDTAEYFKESVIEESEGEKDGFAIEDGKKRREEKAGDLSNSGSINEIRALMRSHPHMGSLSARVHLEMFVTTNL